MRRVDLEVTCLGEPVGFYLSAGLDGDAFGNDYKVLIRCDGDRPLLKSQAVTFTTQVEAESLVLEFSEWEVGSKAKAVLKVDDVVGFQGEGDAENMMEWTGKVFGPHAKQDGDRTILVEFGNQ